MNKEKEKAAGAGAAETRGIGIGTTRPDQIFNINQEARSATLYRVLAPGT